MTGPVAAPGRWHWRNWPVLVKLVAVLLVPTLVALVVGALRIVDQASAVPGYVRVSQIVGGQQELSQLISAAQQERELAVAFVAAGRPGDRRPLDLQFEAVTNRSAQLRAAADGVAELAPTDYRSVLDQLRALQPLRESVTTGASSVEEVVDGYSAAIEPLIALDATLIRKLDEVTVADTAAAMHALVASREQISRQQAIVSAALHANRIETAQLDQVRAAGVRLTAEQEAFTAALEPSERAGYVARVEYVNTRHLK